MQDLANLRRSHAAAEEDAEQAISDLRRQLSEAFGSLEAMTDERDRQADASERREGVLVGQIKALQDEADALRKDGDHDRERFQSLQLKFQATGCFLHAPSFVVQSVLCVS